MYHDFFKERTSFDVGDFSCLLSLITNMSVLCPRVTVTYWCSIVLIAISICKSPTIEVLLLDEGRKG